MAKRDVIEYAIDDCCECPHCESRGRVKVWGGFLFVCAKTGSELIDLEVIHSDCPLEEWI